MPISLTPSANPIKRAGALLSSLLVSAAFSATAAAATEIPTAPSATTSGAAAAGSPTPPPPFAVAAAPAGPLARLFPLTGTADWLSVSYYGSAQGMYDINVESLELGRAWRLGRLLELQGRVGVFHSHGMLTFEQYQDDPDSKATGATFGLGFRLYAFETGRLHVFTEGSAEILYTPGGQEFPAGGTGLNAFLRIGGGVQYQITRCVALEAHYEYTHVSNGAGMVLQNPMWNGRGGGLSIRRSL